VKSIKERTMASKQVNLPLRQLYGLAVNAATDAWSTEVVSRFVEYTYPHDMKEMQVVGSVRDCPICCCGHPADWEPTAGQCFTCKPRVNSHPSFLPILIDGWQESVEGIVVGLCHFRMQPDTFLPRLKNLSVNSTETGGFQLPAGMNSSSETIRKQELYKNLQTRIRFLEGHPDKIMYVEFSTVGRMGLLNADAAKTSAAWEFMLIVHTLQATTRTPIIVILPPPGPLYGMNDDAFYESKREWAEEARKLAIMGHSLGVGFAPLWCNAFCTDNSYVGNTTYRAEPLFGTDGERTREYTRRCTETMFAIHEFVRARLLTKEDFDFLDALP
jgi:hypothetical protein